MHHIAPLPNFAVNKKIMQRDIITINEDLCNGCGKCVNACHEGALQLIDGKARVVSDVYCDGLGACIGECPTGALTIEKREAAPFSETAVKERLKPTAPLACGCPGSAAHSFPAQAPSGGVAEGVRPRQEATCEESSLTHWPVQLLLINPHAPFFAGQDLLLAADCTAYAYGNFHGRFLAGRKLAIACPKLDSNKEAYVEKLTALIDEAKINTLTVLMMEVPCCGGLLQLALSAVAKALRKVPVKKVIIGMNGDILADEWV